MLNPLKLVATGLEVAEAALILSIEIFWKVVPDPIVDKIFGAIEDMHYNYTGCGNDVEERLCP